MPNSQISHNPRLQAALAHARHGRAVLPVYWSIGGRCACGRADCPSPAKHPIPELAPRGVKHATTSRVVIRAWWAHAPLANPALATGEASGVVVLDIDGDHDGFTSLRELLHVHGEIPRTQKVRTGAGEHLYFTYPGAHLKNTAGNLGPGLDVRCCGDTSSRLVPCTAPARSMPGRMAPVRTRSPWPACRHGCSSDSPHRIPDHHSSHVHRIVATPRRRSLRKNNSSCRPRSASANTRLNLAAFRLGRFIATEALAHGDVEAVLDEPPDSAFLRTKLARPSPAVFAQV